MKKMALLLAAVGMLGLTGCSNLSTNVQSSNVAIGTTANFQADLNVGDKISGTCSVTSILGLINLGDTDKEASGVTFDATNSVAGQGGKSPFDLIVGLNPDPVAKCARAAAYNAVIKNGADVIFAPRYTAEITNFILFKTINVNLTGYKATIKGFKQLDTQKILEGKR